MDFVLPNIKHCKNILEELKPKNAAETPFNVQKKHGIIILFMFHFTFPYLLLLNLKLSL